MTSLIKFISLENFKGFSDEVRIELRPVTLLFGANSVGKSTVLQAFQLVREVLESGNANIDRTIQGGDTVDLGGFKNFVHDRDLDLDNMRSVSITIGMELGNTSIPEFFEDVIEERSDVDDKVLRFHKTLDQIRIQVRSVSVKLTLSWSSLRGVAVISRYQVNFNEEWFSEVLTRPDGRQPQLIINSKHPIFHSSDIDGKAVFGEIAEWIEPRSDPYVFRSELGVRTLNADDEVPEAIPDSVILDVLDAVRRANADSPNRGFAGWLQGFQGALPRLDKPILIPASKLESSSNLFVLQEFSAFMSWMLIGPAQLLREQLRKSRYVGPLRRIPPRDFDVALSKNEGAWSDGMAAWQILMGGPEPLVSSCSDWMSSDQKLGTGYGVERAIVQEFDVGGLKPKPLGNRRSRLALVDKLKRRHLPQDVGVGISQVLPVIVAAQDDAATIVCIEQPELHIHPAVQVGLGDLFIDGVLNKGLSFLVETHSEHLVMRLQRRMREHMLGESTDEFPSLNPNDLSFVYLGKKSTGAVRATHIGLTADGKFDASWPNGFFGERAVEALTPTMRAKFESARSGRTTE